MDLNALEKQLIIDEEIRLKPYNCSEGKLTIGIGRNLEDRGLSLEEAMFLLHNDIASTMKECEQLPFWLKLSDVRQQVVANMCFNMGMPKLLGFKRMMAALADGHYIAAAIEMEGSLWFSQVGDRAVRLVKMMREGK